MDLNGNLRTLVRFGDDLSLASPVGEAEDLIGKNFIQISETAGP
ncbi:hypothetical protein C943_01341 [Mariniradius saccharolyticus AK6]|uniref:Uncharacterized protein n=1 Tax=Mariniradius saccharolyticus AK6 TaxID=1239962 RepID=M7XB02_9BACT|nr:hypothetical protein C943_01341 [Mariniradius saccharolyticus AK6]